LTVRYKFIQNFKIITKILTQQIVQQYYCSVTQLLSMKQHFLKCSWANQQQY